MSISTKMTIPATITVGYQKRDDTYTGKLAYVIYTDNKGVLRKEKSWQGWRNNKIPSNQFDNTPMSGFVLNKKAGGYKTGWDMRNTYVRVYDPRDFEFEISIPNLLFILQETSSIKGKGLEGEFVYSWHGTELVLLPTCSAEYQECLKFNKHQIAKVTKEDMVEGCTYLMKDMTNVLYLGKQSYCERTGYDKATYDYRPVGPRHVFLPLEKMTGWNPQDYIVQTGFTKIAARTSDEVSPLYADAYDKLRNSRYCNRVVEVKIVKAELTKSKLDSGYDMVFLLQENNKYFPVRIWRNYRYSNYSDYSLVRGEEFKPVVKDGTCVLPKLPNRYRNGNEISEPCLLGKDLYTAILITEKGHEFDLTNQK